ncbi:MAG: peptidylprolyl isomerase [Candidatus Roizmanbacteria bacterium]
MQKKYLLIPLIFVIGIGGFYFYRNSFSDDQMEKKIVPSASVAVLPTDAQDISQPPISPTLPISPIDDMSKKTSLKKPKMLIDVNKSYTATLQTSEGDIQVALTASQTPNIVNNFVYLARQGFYDGTIFHRVIKDFMIQGGDPKGDGTGGPGYRLDDEPFDGEYTPGTLAMANAGPNTNGSQFFIMHGNVPLPKAYVIFGKVIQGMNIVDRIATAPTKINRASGEESTPVTPVKVEKITIEEK